jgi:putative membrane protein insertion efficiency factor
MKTPSTAILFLFLSYLLCVKSNRLAAQSKADIARHKAVLSTPEKRIYKEAKGNKNEVEALFSGLFLTYKTVLSSQDGNVCSFTPSCSEFGILAVKQHGLVMGGIKTMDRLTRCNGLSPEKYSPDPQTKLLIDRP